jgi:hypothetical protein
VGRTRFRQPGKVSARQCRRMSYRLLGVGAVVLAVGLLSALPVAARPDQAAAHLSMPRLRLARPWSGPKVPHTRATRRAPFLTWARHKSFSAASIVNTYKVTTTADVTAASCPATTAEPCTLRQAVNQANTDGTLDKIQVPAATSPYLVSLGQLVITDPAGVVISGKGRLKTVIEADKTSTTYPFRVLQINSGSNVEISNLTIEDGHSSTPNEDGNGGGIEVVSGALTMRNSTVTANTADVEGGGIYVAGRNSIKNDPSGTESQAYLKNDTISKNTASNGGGGLDLEGQAISQGGSISGNTAPTGDGGGIRLGGDGEFFPSLSAADLNLTANTVGAGLGGGILNEGSLDLSGGTIGGPSAADGNSTGGVGGGLLNDQVATLSDVTVEHNGADFGGGIENDHQLSMTGGSLSHNLAQDGAGLDNNGGQTNLQGVTVSRNRARDRAGGVGNVGLQGSLSTSGGTISGNRAPNGGGGVYTSESASLGGTSITGNTAKSGDGGGILSTGPLTLTGVQLGTTTRPNVAQDGGGLATEAPNVAPTGCCFAIRTFATTIVRSTVAGNEARDAGSGLGGGILNIDGTSDELRQTTVTGNSADNAGGGIVNDGATMTILTSTISGNESISGSSAVFGGGIANTALLTSGPTATLNMVNDTVTGNRAGGGTTAGFGGGIENNDPGASVTLTNVTVSGNRAGSSGAGGGIFNDGVAALRGTILAGNTAANAHSNCGLPRALTSNGYNLSSDSTCGLTGVGDQTAVNPLLGPLANNGGPTETMALKVNSPAIDAVQFCPPPKTDQRGVKRQGPCDVGAYERVPDK